MMIIMSKNIKVKNKIKIEPEKFYYFKHLREYLKSKNLIHSRPTLIKLEKRGLIPAARASIEFDVRSPRIYTGTQIIEIAEIIKEAYSSCI